MKEKQLYFLNAYGIRVKKCCASCKHQQADNKARYCMRGEGLVSPKSYCMDWDLRSGLGNAGKGTGKVKKVHYLQYCLKVMEDENAESYKHSQKNVLFARSTISEIRQSYNEQYGDIYAL